MSELDRFGLAGLLRMIHSESPDVASLAVGQDLMTLGLDLNQAEYGNRSFSSLVRTNLFQTFTHVICFTICLIYVRSSS
jgi:CCR4-NOT transcription complex subunit 2